MYYTNKDIVTLAFRISGDSAWVLPAGSRVTLVRGLNGLTGDGFVAADVAQLKRLSGNSHDPVYRYLTIQAADVEGKNDSAQETVKRIRAAEQA